MRMRQLASAAVAASVIAIGGCRVDTHKDGGGNENVSVATPFGAVKVKTNDSEGVAGLGLPVYPGATMEKEGKDKNGSADVNLSFGKFQLRVKAASYRTPDSTEQVTAYYRDALKQYGSVIACNHDKPIGSPTRTEEGLTCSDNNKHAQVNETSSAKVELKAGSKQHQHIVAIEPQSGGTKFGLVALDLPAGLSGDGEPDARQ